ncbi:26S proteasome regulatory subunit 6B homolog [Medicago truncatula]|uniref:26S proteasome regulatory subunit 6B homolog n=1 Tax=Medicago truncatula TaxID=3880 RepID=UPI000D2F2914|nr:26S proteasome regulatory subunit 6B homolog [Medicago truncatula]
MDMELRLFTDMPFIGGFVFELANCGAATSVITGYTLWSHYYIQLGLALSVTTSLYSWILMPEVSDIAKIDIGGCDIQKQEIREAVELPLTHHELYKQIGIDPPRGVLVYGPPGTGKTMLVKAVANHTNAAFIRVVGSSEFVQKYLGEETNILLPTVFLFYEKSAITTFNSCSFEKPSSPRSLPFFI